MITSYAAQPAATDLARPLDEFSGHSTSDTIPRELVEARLIERYGAPYSFWRNKSDEEKLNAITIEWTAGVETLSRRSSTTSALRRAAIAPKWLVDGLLPEGSLAFLWGNWSTFKSFLALDWCLSIATGSDWMGRTTRQANVMYIPGEGRGPLTGRIDAWSLHHGIEVGDAFRVEHEMLKLQSDDLVTEFIDSMWAFAPELVVVDTLAHALTDADENSFAHMNGVGGALERIAAELKATVLVLHHSTKDRGSFRGHSSLPARADVVFESRSSKGNISLFTRKMRDAAQPEVIKLRAVPAYDSVVLVGDTAATSASTPARPKAPSPADRVLQVLEQAGGTEMRAGEIMAAAGVSKSALYVAMSDLGERVVHPARGRYRSS